MKITIFNSQKVLPVSRKHMKEIISCILSKKSVECEEVIVHFVSKRKISSLHAAYFDDPSPTDCISFPIDQSILGEIFVCPEVALEYAALHKKDPNLELILYVVHGLLHLLGYDDIDPKERREMRRQERKCLQWLQEVDKK